jgi:hypothetical protein
LCLVGTNHGIHAVSSCIAGVDTTFLALSLARIFHKKAQTSCKSLIEWKV